MLLFTIALTGCWGKSEKDQVATELRAKAVELESQGESKVARMAHASASALEQGKTLDEALVAGQHAIAIWDTATAAGMRAEAAEFEKQYGGDNYKQHKRKIASVFRDAATALERDKSEAEIAAGMRTYSQSNCGIHTKEVLHSFTGNVFVLHSPYSIYLMMSEDFSMISINDYCRYMQRSKE